MTVNESLDAYTPLPMDNAKLKSIQARKHTAPYMIHRYFARRPWNLFENLIECYSRPNQIVLDPFCGGGVTAYESLKLKRKVIACDINPLSTYIVKNMFHHSLPDNFASAFNDVTSYLKELCRKSYQIDCPSCKNETTIGWYELTHTVACAKCTTLVILSENNKIRNGIYRCSNSKCAAKSEGFSVARTQRQKPLYVSYHGKCDNCGKKFAGQINEALRMINDEHIDELGIGVEAARASLPPLSIPLEWDRQKEDLLADKGIRYFQDFFTKKNLCVNYLLLHKINSYKETNRKAFEILRFVFSDSLRETNIMTFALEGWQNGKPNSWAKHAYWIPSQFCEQNVYQMFLRSFRSLNNCIAFNKKQGPNFLAAKSFPDLFNDRNILLKTGTIKQLGLPNESVDVVITDPPYGSNVQYLELSHFWYLWNKDLYDTEPIMQEDEAVVNRKSHLLKEGKTYLNYENNLFAVFSECFRVLRDEGRLVMTFNNKDLNSWLALVISIYRAGFQFEGGITFQDGIANYRNTAHTKAAGSPYGDYVYEFIRRKSPKIDLDKNSFDRSMLARYMESRLRRAREQCTEKNIDKNVIMIEFFNAIIPQIGMFVRTNLEDSVSHDLYEIFAKNDLSFLFD